MTLARLIPLDVHGALETALAALMIVAPFALGFTSGALVMSVVAGSLLLAVAVSSQTGGSSVLPLSSHAAVDACFTMALAIGAAGFALSGDVTAGLFFAASALAITLLASLTRYSEKSA
jgi:hypothetical protein